MILSFANRLIRNCVASIAAIASLSSCSDSSLNPELPDTPGQTPDAPLGEAPRSVLVYMLADNSLGANGYDRDNTADMIEAARNGSFGSSRLIIYHDDRKASRPMLKEVTPMGLRIIREYGDELSSVSPQRLEDVIDDFKAAAPAKIYGMIFWSHGQGWQEASEGSMGSTATIGTLASMGTLGWMDSTVSLGWMDSMESSTDISEVPFDPSDPGISPQWLGEDRRHYMDVTAFADAMRGKGFDYIYFDCCFMASVESLYEMRDVADQFAASCTELHAEGMPYLQTLPMLMAEDADIVGAAAATFAKYDALQGVNRSATMSVIKSAALDRLAEATGQLYALSPSLPANAEIQEFERPKLNGEPCYLFDFEDYVTKLYLNSDSREMRRAYAEWLIALDECVIYRDATPSIFGQLSIRSHCGLSTFPLRRPEDACVKGYDRLAWYTDVASQLYPSN